MFVVAGLSNTAWSQTRATTDLEALVKAATPFAEEMLTNHGEFYPYGNVMRADGTIGSIGGYNGDEHPDPREIAELIRSSYRRDAAAHVYRATVLVYNGVVKVPSTGNKSDALVLEFDHEDDLSIVVFIPYSLNGKDLEVQPSFTTEGAHQIFAKQRTPVAD
jgi:hypothetical protein